MAPIYLFILVYHTPTTRYPPLQTLRFHYFGRRHVLRYVYTKKRWVLKSCVFPQKRSISKMQPMRFSRFSLVGFVYKWTRYRCSPYKDLAWSGGTMKPWLLFLDASSHLYKRVCPSICPSVRRSPIFFRSYYWPLDGSAWLGNSWVTLNDSG